MQGTIPGEFVTVVSMTLDGTTSTNEVRLDAKGDIGYFGIVSNTSGMSFTTPNIMLDSGRNPLYGTESVTDAASSLLSYIGGPLKGFSPIPQSVHWWYDTPMGDVFWILISIFYWIFWLNIMLGVSNAIPAVPFDGGFIFHGGLSALLERLGMKDEEKREALVGRTTNMLSMVMILMLILVIMAVIL
jgi:membrane-associated protease RseP (regulator of RpoE activity)